MAVSRLRHVLGIGVDQMAEAVDAAHDPEILSLENLDTDLAPPRIALDVTHRAIEDDAANSYLPFEGHWSLRRPAAEHVGRMTGVAYDPRSQCLSVAGGLNGITNARSLRSSTTRSCIFYSSNTLRNSQRQPT
jgi:aspartate/methionine/tyrosine aminotransferase